MAFNFAAFVDGYINVVELTLYLGLKILSIRDNNFQRVITARFKKMEYRRFWCKRTHRVAGAASGVGNSRY